MRNLMFIAILLGGYGCRKSDNADQAKERAGRLRETTHLSAGRDLCVALNGSCAKGVKNDCWKAARCFELRERAFPAEAKIPHDQMEP